MQNFFSFKSDYHIISFVLSPNAFPMGFVSSATRLLLHNLATLRDLEGQAE